MAGYKSYGCSCNLSSIWLGMAFYSLTLVSTAGRERRTAMEALQVSRAAFARQTLPRTGWNKRRDFEHVDTKEPYQDGVGGEVDSHKFGSGKIAELLLGFRGEQSHLAIEADAGREPTHLGFNVEPAGLIPQGWHVQHVLEFQHLVERLILMAIPTFVKGEKEKLSPVTYGWQIHKDMTRWTTISNNSLLRRQDERGEKRALINHWQQAPPREKKKWTRRQWETGPRKQKVRVSPPPMPLHLSISYWGGKARETMREDDVRTWRCWTRWRGRPWLRRAGWARLTVGVGR